MLLWSTILQNPTSLFIFHHLGQPGGSDQNMVSALFLLQKNGEVLQYFLLEYARILLSLDTQFHQPTSEEVE